MRHVAAIGLALALAGCAGNLQLAESAGALQREYAELQDQGLLLNILRRSAGLPARFTAISTINGRSRVTAGADLNVPFGREAPANFTFNPRFEADVGPGFEISTQNNQEFYRGFLEPVSTSTLELYARRNLPAELILPLFIERIQIATGDASTVYSNNPDRPADMAAFEALVRRLIDQGFTLEDASLTRRFGPELRMDSPPGVDQLMALRKEKLSVEATGAGAYQIVQTARVARFCFRAPREALFERARCHDGTNPPSFRVEDPAFFGSIDSAQVRYAAPGGGTLTLQMRSLADLLSYLGARVRTQLAAEPGATGAPGDLPPPIVVRPAAQVAEALVRTEFNGRSYAIPAGDPGHRSGAVLSILAELLAQVQSVEDLPFSRSLRLVGP